MMVKARAASLFCTIVMASVVSQIGAVFASEAPRWFVDGRPTLESIQAVRLLEAAGDDGLNPNDYQAYALARALDSASHGIAPAAATQAVVSEVLSRALEQLIRDMHSGRVSPRAVHASFGLPASSLDPFTYLRDAVRSGQLPQAVAALRPRVPLYAALMRVLASYRVLESDPVLRRPLPPLPTSQVSIGQAYTGLAVLAAKLVTLGDLPSSYETGRFYDQVLAAAVAAFQERHGLAPDGVIGRDTLRQLNKPLALRIRQIELTLERLRWIPLLPERIIVVNIPEFVLRANQVSPSGQPISMKVVVGKTPETRTPLFVGEIRVVEFSPYWNIPSSIARNEIVPALLRDRASFARQGLEFVGPDGTVTDTLSNVAMDKARRGSLRLRQRPGPANPLGRIKFVIPNHASIYLHDTPVVQLFHRPRRDFSHGCIRVEDPFTLAKFVFEGQVEWTDERIHSAMDSGKSFAVRINHPIPVVIAYATAIVKRDGKVYFYDDIYGNDQLLDAALVAQQKLRRAQPDLLPADEKKTSGIVHGGKSFRPPAQAASGKQQVPQ